MLKKLFNALTIFAFLSVACFIMLLFYNQSRGLRFFIKPYHMEKGSNNLTWHLRERSQELWELEGNATNEAHFPALNSSLELCPDKPPHLVGALLVEFNFKRTLDDMRQELKFSVQRGGRYKPPDCIARQKVAIIIPFRNRHEHLKEWLYYLYPILKRQQLDFTVYVINQDGEGIFNRAKLLNVGFMEALKDHDYECFVFSDVDLVPMDDRNLYRCFDNPRHLAVAMDKFNFHLPYKGYFGGVSSLSRDQFLRINGFPNTYWGWGGEDDDIYNRIIYNGMSISRPDFVIGKYRMIRHLRDLHNEPNPKNPDKLVLTKLTMAKDGINNVKYTVKKVMKDLLYTFITVDIQAPSS